jgi:hypothetical protein
MTVAEYRLPNGTVYHTGKLTKIGELVKTAGEHSAEGYNVTIVKTTDTTVLTTVVFEGKPTEFSRELPISSLGGRYLKRLSKMDLALDIESISEKKIQLLDSHCCWRSNGRHASQNG